MEPNLTDAPNVFNRLCHLAALSKDGRIKGAVDNLILTLFAISKDTAMSTTKQVATAVNAYYSLPLKEETIQSSIDTNLSKGYLLRNRSTKILSLSSEVRGEIDNHITEANNLENQVRAEWLTSLDEQGTYNSEMKSRLWHALASYMAKAFNRHGAETVALLDPSNQPTDSAKETLATYLDKAIKEHCSDIPYQDASRLISGFFTDPPPNRTRYVAQLLDGTFTYFALTVDQFTATYLKEGLSPMSLFLDTNFIFGMLDLNESPLKDVSLELVESVKRYNLPFKLYYHEETLRELRWVIGSAGDDLRSRHWSQAMSRAAIQAGFLHGISLRYHTLNMEIPTDVDVFLSKLEHIEEVLSDYGLNIYRITSDKSLDEQRHLLVADYSHFMEGQRPLRPKSYEALNHDIAVWQTVNRLQKDTKMVFGAGAYFVTTDYYLYRFDWLRLRKRGLVGTVILSNQLMQLLRPFIPTDRALDESFVEIFAIPEFRTIVRDYSKTSEKVFTYLSTFADLKEQTAVRILTDEVLTRQLHDVEEGSKEFHDIIENAITKENEQLREQAEKLKAEVESSNKSARVANEKIKTFEEIAREKEEALQLSEVQKMLR